MMIQRKKDRSFSPSHPCPPDRRAFQFWKRDPAFYILPFAFCLLLFIFSCKVGKEYKRPSLEVPDQFNNVSFADTSSIADIEWKKFFTDPDLQILISKGLTYNHDLLTAMKNIEIAQQRMKQAKLLLLPELN